MCLSRSPQALNFVNANRTTCAANVVLQTMHKMDVLQHVGGREAVRQLGPVGSILASTFDALDALNRSAKVDATQLFNAMKWPLEQQQDPNDFLQRLMELIPGLATPFHVLELGVDGGIKPDDTLDNLLRDECPVTTPPVLALRLHHCLVDNPNGGSSLTSTTKWPLDTNLVLGYKRLAAVWARETTNNSTITGHIVAFVEQCGTWYRLDDRCESNRGPEQVSLDVCVGCDLCRCAVAVPNIVSEVASMDVLNLFYSGPPQVTPCLVVHQYLCLLSLVSPSRRNHQRRGGCTHSAPRICRLMSRLLRCRV